MSVPNSELTDEVYESPTVLQSVYPFPPDDNAAFNKFVDKAFSRTDKNKISKLTRSLEALDKNDKRKNSAPLCAIFNAILDAFDVSHPGDNTGYYRVLRFSERSAKGMKDGIDGKATITPDICGDRREVRVAASWRLQLTPVCLSASVPIPAPLLESRSNPSRSQERLDCSFEPGGNICSKRPCSHWMPILRSYRL